jgi:hypothetical protein
MICVIVIIVSWHKKYLILLSLDTAVLNLTSDLYNNLTSQY